MRIGIRVRRVEESRFVYYLRGLKVMRDVSYYDRLTGDVPYVRTHRQILLSSRLSPNGRVSYRRGYRARGSLSPVSCYFKRPI